MRVERLVIVMIVVIRVVMIMIVISVVMIVIVVKRFVMNRVAVVLVRNGVKREVQRRDENGPEEENAGDESREHAMSPRIHGRGSADFHDAQPATTTR